MRPRPRGMLLDQLARFAPVADAVLEAEAHSLLDVGSGSGGVGSLLSRRLSVTAVDTDFSDYGSGANPPDDGVRRLTADARELPFAAGEFDVAVAVDVLEHIAPNDRGTVIAELCRVASRRVVVACPAGPVAWESDRKLAEAHDARGQPPAWLAEHLEHPFPDPACLAAELGRFGRVTVVASESIAAHERIMRLESRRPGALLSLAAGALLVPPLGTGLRSRLAARLRGNDGEPAYRAIAVADRVQRPG